LSCSGPDGVAGAELFAATGTWQSLAVTSAAPVSLTEVEFVEVVGAGLVVTLVGGCATWLFRNRRQVRQRLCRHDWEKREGFAEPGVLFFPQPDRCRKCGLER
jgi:hypothetical protein